jgi:CHASE2 domain-containing sensor protein
MAARLTLLYGRSGVGKSSVLHAGVVHRLREVAREEADVGERPEMVVVVQDAWQGDPVAALRDGVRETMAQWMPADQRAAVHDQPSLADTLAAWTEAASADLLVILDQFEDYFLYHPDEDGSGTWAVEFPRAVSRQDLRVNFLVSIREEAVASLDRFEGRIPAVFGNLIRLEPLSPEGGRRAIEGPIERYNGGRPPAERVEVQPDFVDDLLRQVETGRVGVGPVGAGGRVAERRSAGPGPRIEAAYLQLVMDTVWSETLPASRVLRRSTLDRLGGAEGIFRRHLDQRLERLSPDDRRVASELFRHLVTPSGTKIAHRPVDLAEYANAEERVVERVLAYLAREEVRILAPVPAPGTPPGGAYEIFHDVLGRPILDWRARFQAAEREAEVARVSRARAIAMGLAFAVAVVLISGAYLLWPNTPLDLAAIDGRFELRGTTAAPADVVVVGIDETSRRPYPRGRIPYSAHAEVIERLRLDGARAIAYDVEFEGRRSGDEELRQAVTRAQRVLVLGTWLTYDDGARTRSVIFNADNILARVTSQPGYAGVIEDSLDGAVRRIPYEAEVEGRGGVGVKALAVATTEVATGRTIQPSHELWIDYHGPAGTFGQVPFHDVSTAPGGFFRDRIVVVGSTAPAPGKDDHRIPTSAPGDGMMAGVEIHANAISTLLRGEFRRLRALDLASITLLALLPPLIGRRLGRRARVGLLTVSVLVFLGVAQYAFERGVILAVAWPLTGLLLGSLLPGLMRRAFREPPPSRAAASSDDRSRRHFRYRPQRRTPGGAT